MNWIKENLANLLIAIYIVIAIGAFGYAANNEKDGYVPAATLFWPLYISYKYFEPPKASKEE